MTPDAVTLEVVEQTKTEPTSGAATVLVPTEVRLNGVPVLCPEGHSVVVHEMNLGDNDAAYVTLTMFVKKLTISHEVTE